MPLVTVGPPARLRALPLPAAAAVATDDGRVIVVVLWPRVPTATPPPTPAPTRAATTATAHRRVGRFFGALTSVAGDGGGGGAAVASSVVSRHQGQTGASSVRLSVWCGSMVSIRLNCAVGTCEVAVGWLCASADLRNRGYVSPGRPGWTVWPGWPGWRRGRRSCGRSWGTGCRRC